MSDQHSETSKQRVSRIALDAFKRRDLVQWLRIWSIALVSIGTVAYLGYGWWTASTTRYSHGPVAQVHAPWENNCTVCHEPFLPIRPDAWSHDWTNAHKTTTDKCNRCHFAARHHAETTHLESQMQHGCVVCHSEHLGRSARLTAVADSGCTNCHARLDGVRKHSASPDRIAPQVTGFAEHSHPPFRSLTRDPGRLKFNHRLHLAPGLVTQPGDPGATRIQDLPPGSRERYRLDGQDDAAPVQLDCASCHTLDGGSTTDSGGYVGGADGEYFQPIAYQQHCQACHPLRYDMAAPEQLLQHRLTFAEMRTELEETYLRQRILRQPDIQLPVVPKRPVPGKHSLPADPQLEAVAQAVASFVDRGMRVLEGETCVKCHQIEREAGAPYPVIQPTNIPEVWFRHARFNHLSHRTVACARCHAQATGDAPGNMPDHETVMIAGLETCVQCHAPRSKFADSESFVGARFDCVECHRYHVDSVTPNQERLWQAIETYIDKSPSTR